MGNIELHNEIVCEGFNFSTIGGSRWDEIRDHNRDSGSHEESEEIIR